MGSIIEISDVELMELLGKKDCEIAMDEKTIENYKTQFEKVKALALELEGLKKGKTELEASNKSLSDTNIKLDQILTEARKERDMYNTQLNIKKEELIKALSESERRRLEFSKQSIELDNMKLDLSKKTSEIQTMKSQLAGKTSEWESQVIELNTSKNELETMKLDLEKKTSEMEALNVKHDKGKKRSSRKSANA